MNHKLLWVFSYDIADDRRRLKVMKLLRNHGVRVNLSVFECILTRDEAHAFGNRLRRLLRKGKDHLRVYRVCGACQADRLVYGTYQDSDEPVVHVE